ncbi:autotransporter domain-containing protein [Azoarcus sp. L1K30]|uniref:autotransporter domain-containing protein n=1 Tax=Azoarcus sp. L1K30 TaxID=2820277 RepID=UPI001B8313BD|nr:autotransporter domain-containing protein [Azoarcus sp. L1K30]MBR0567449.1 autotransporter domain-containing protein [Azoarcus sp. L1K30]
MKRINVPVVSGTKSGPSMLRIALAVSAALAVEGVYAVEPGIHEFGVTPWGSSSIASGISGDGTVVAVTITKESHLEEAWWAYRYEPVAYRWTESEGLVALGTLGGTGGSSYASAVSADGKTIVGNSEDLAVAEHAYPYKSWVAFRWTESTGMTRLGTLDGSTRSLAYGVSADGTVVVGAALGSSAWKAFRWTETGGMVDLGTLGSAFANSEARAVSADGTVIVGQSDARAFRWTQAEGMINLGVINGGFSSIAYGVSADGTVIVGTSDDGAFGNANKAFRWTQAGGLQSLGVIDGGVESAAYGISGDGRVIVGYVFTVNGNVRDYRAMRWTEATGMQTVEDWLRDSGVVVPEDITYQATATNQDGSIVVGQLTNRNTNQRAFIARGASGLVAVDDLRTSLGAAATGANAALSTAGTVFNGANSRPLSRRVAAGQKAFWLVGDWGTDNHGTRDGDLGLAEAGLGYNFGPLQLNVSLGQSWAKQELTLNGRVRSDGTYLLAEALMPVSDSLWATIGGYGYWGDSDIRRGYQNAGVQSSSVGTPDVDAWGLRARLDWDNAYRVGGADFSPYVDLSYTEAKLDAYTETGGGFPAHFDARTDAATELRVGVNAARPLAGSVKLLGVLEAAHRFEGKGDRTSGVIVGLFDFDFAGTDYKQDWLRAGVGVEGTMGGGKGSLMLNATTKGEAPSFWLSAGWQMAF